MSEPFAERPDAIGQPGGHRWRPGPPCPAFLDPKRPHRQAEVVAVRHEVRRTVVHPLAPREAVRLALLAAVLPAVRRVVPLHERRVDVVLLTPERRSHTSSRPHTPNTTDVSTSTTRPFSRLLVTVAYTSPAGSSLRGEGVRPGPGLRCGCTHSP